MISFGASGGELPAAGFSYNRASRLATWTFAAPLRADKLLLELSDAVHDAQSGLRLDGNWADGRGVFPSGNNIVESDDAFRFRLDVLPGDGNADGRVERADLMRLIGRLSTSIGGASYEARFDIDGSGRIDLDDLRSVLRRLNNALPTAEPISSPSGPAVTAVDVFFQRVGQAQPAHVEAAASEPSNRRQPSSSRRISSRRALDMAMQTRARHEPRQDSALRRTAGRRVRSAGSADDLTFGNSVY
ncbi:MAG: hypothetical protein IIA67_11070 [Planctomycetes bacterium]|nr:hypothetical protein [Planctomycetota bacterium]